MRALHIIESLPPAGAEQVLVNTLPAMKDLGVASEVAVLWPPYDLAQPLRERGILVRELDLPSIWSARRGITVLRRVIAEGGYDVIHAHLPMAVFYAAAAKGSIPVVATFHGLSFERYPANTFAKRMRRQLERWWTNHRVNAYIAVSTAVADHYHRTLHIPLEKIDIIPNGFPIDQLVRDPTLDVESVRRSYGLDPGDFVSVHAGRFIASKGHIHLLRAVLELRRRALKFKLLLFGQGTTKPEIESFLVQNQLEDVVKVCAPLPHRELLRVFQASDLFVFPSVSEGFGMAAGEAMCMGLPVIASNLPGIASLIEDGVSGLLVPPGDPEALANAIELAITQPDRRQQIAIGARKRIVENFSMEKIAAKIVAVYQSLVFTD